MGLILSLHRGFCIGVHNTQLFHKLINKTMATWPTRGNPPAQLATGDAIDNGHHGRADGDVNNQAEPPEASPHSCHLTSSNNSDLVMTSSGGHRLSTVSTGEILPLPYLDSPDSPPASADDDSATLAGSGKISDCTIVPEQPAYIITNIPGASSNLPSIDSSLEDGGGKLTPLADDVSRAERETPHLQLESAPPCQTLTPSVPEI